MVFSVLPWRDELAATTRFFRRRFPSIPSRAAPRTSERRLFVSPPTSTSGLNYYRKSERLILLVLGIDLLILIFLLTLIPSVLRRLRLRERLRLRPGAAGRAGGAFKPPWARTRAGFRTSASADGGRARRRGGATRRARNGIQRATLASVLRNDS